MNAFPMQEIERIEKICPGLFAEIDRQKPTNTDEFVGAVYSALKKSKKAKMTWENVKEFATDELLLIQHLSIWQHHRVVYRFDKALWAELAAQAERISSEENLPIELIRNLPYPCVAIETNPFMLTDENTGDQLAFTGNVMFRIESDLASVYGWESLTAVWQLSDGKWESFHFPIHDGTVGDNIDFLRNDLQKKIPPDRLTDECLHMITYPQFLLIQAILYLQAENADMQKVPAPKQKRKKSRKKQSQKAHVDVVNVGIRVGRLLRNAAQHKREIQSAGGGSAKRPHSRRGHWHHFWIGSKREPENRRLVLRWVEPTFIHQGTRNNTTTIFDVK